MRLTAGALPQQAGREALACEAAAAAEAALWQQLDAAQQRPDALEMDLWTLHEQVGVHHSHLMRLIAEGCFCACHAQRPADRVSACKLGRCRLQRMT